MKIFLKLGCGLLFLCWHFCSWAADPDQIYQVEVVIFSHITEAGLRSEYWPVPPPLTISPLAVTLSGDQILPKSAWDLKSTQQLLGRNNPILLHIAWEESATEARKGRIIHVTTPQVDGTVAIRLERYFSVHFNLRFTLPWDQIKDYNLQNIAHDNDNPYIAFTLNEYLRMRSNEINYIDHPLYGILIKIIPKSAT